MTRRDRLVYIAYVTAACGNSLLILGSGWMAGPVHRWRPANILFWEIRNVLGFPAFVLLLFGIGSMFISDEIRRNPLSSITLTLLVMAVIRGIM